MGFNNWFIDFIFNSFNKNIISLIFLIKRSPNKMAVITLKCESCNMALTLKGHDDLSNYFINNYGCIDKVTGRLFEQECPLCNHAMKPHKNETNFG